MLIKQGKYYIDQESSSVLRIGGSDKFVPNVNLSKWDDEVFFNWNFSDLLVSAETETYENGIITLTKGDFTCKWYLLNQDVLEWEIIVARKVSVPSVLNFKLEYSSGLQFWYQGEVPDEHAQKYVDSGRAPDLQAAKRIMRPENVLGSYAIYADPTKRHNKYQTGKVAHLYRWVAIAADGQKAFCDLTINEASKQLSIALPSQWLKTAAYPVKFMGHGHTLGRTSRGASSDYWTSRITSAGVFNPGENGTISEAHQWLAVTNAAYNSKVGLFTDNGSNVPNATVDAVAVINPSATGSPQEVTTTGLNISISSQNYHIGMIQDSTDGYTSFYYDSPSGGQYSRFDTVNYASFTHPLSWSDDGSGGQYHSSWFVYTATGGGGTPDPTLPGGDVYRRRAQHIQLH